MTHKLRYVQYALLGIGIQQTIYVSLLAHRTASSAVSHIHARSAYQDMLSLMKMNVSWFVPIIATHA